MQYAYIAALLLLGVIGSGGRRRVRAWRETNNFLEAEAERAGTGMVEQR